MNSNQRRPAVLGHIGIEVTNLTQSKKFYQALLSELGFQIVMDNENAVGFTNQTFQVWLAKPVEQRVKRRSPSGEEFIVADHLAILVQDSQLVDAVEKEMRRKGFEPLFPSEEHPDF